ncbi:MAG TPA: hypothetical protein H9722_01330 [Candidatus Mediterraneibacter pullistercoris]|nr:hypothetical protein [Candidatus Mediterraneibacter pullistercoris]
MKKITIEYNGATCEDHWCFLNDYPQFSGGSKQYNTYAVPGMDGELVESDDYLSNLQIDCTFSIISKRFMDNVRDIRSWLSGSGNLVISDSPDVFYKVWKTEYGDISREIRKFGTFAASFICTPFEFLKDGQIPVDSVMFNPNDKAKPIYTIMGEGLCTLTVNGYEFTANVGQGAVINSERQLSYKNDGQSINTDVTGDYERLWLPHGENEVSVSSGFTLSIIPQWGYRI